MLTGQVDAFDVRSGMNPCSGMQPGKIYVGGEQDRPAGSSGCWCVMLPGKFSILHCSYADR